MSKILLLLCDSAINTVIGDPFEILTTVPSTNNYAMEKVRSGLAGHGGVYFALAQTEGKGQRSKRWYSAAGENITMSVILMPGSTSVARQFLLNCCVALAVRDFFNKRATVPCFIKWPNDIYLNDRKAAGIVIENSVAGSTWQFAIAGLGININQVQFPESVKATSLSLATGEQYNVVNLAKEICGLLQARYLQFIHKEYSALLQEYNGALFRKDETVKLKNANVLFDATIKRVDENGFLIVENGMELSYGVGQVEWRL